MLTRERISRYCLVTWDKLLEKKLVFLCRWALELGPISANCVDGLKPVSRRCPLLFQHPLFSLSLALCLLFCCLLFCWLIIINADNVHLVLVCRGLCPTGMIGLQSATASHPATLHLHFLGRLPSEDPPLTATRGKGKRKTKQQHRNSRANLTESRRGACSLASASLTLRKRPRRGRPRHHPTLLLVLVLMEASKIITTIITIAVIIEIGTRRSATGPVRSRPMATRGAATSTNRVTRKKMGTTISRGDHQGEKGRGRMREGL